MRKLFSVLEYLSVLDWLEQLQTIVNIHSCKEGLSGGPSTFLVASIHRLTEHFLNCKKVVTTFTFTTFVYGLMMYLYVIDLSNYTSSM